MAEEAYEWRLAITDGRMFSIKASESGQGFVATDLRSEGEGARDLEAAARRREEVRGTLCDMYAFGRLPRTEQWALLQEYEKLTGSV